MPDINKIIKSWERCKECHMHPVGTSQAYLDCEYTIGLYCGQDKLIWDTLELLKELSSTLGIVQTADKIIFTSTGDAAKGEARGLMLGKAMMRDEIEREIILRNMMTDELREIFRQVKIE